MATTTPALPADSGSVSADRTAIDQRLEALLREGPGRPTRLMEAMRYAVLGPGKRLRPRLVLMAARACNANDPADALPAACAVEMIHAYSLAHDDLPAMDDDDLRRGRPTIHKRYDEATAILVGDALQALAFEALADGAATPEIAARWCSELARAAGPAALVGGQVDDLAGVDGAAGADALDLLRAIHRRKTGAMITVSLRLGAIAADAEEQPLSCLSAFGDALGLLFQVTDDLLDATGDQEAVGKRVGKDAEAGKLTYPGLMGLEPSRRFAAELADRALGELSAFDERAEPLRELTREMVGRDR